MTVASDGTTLQLGVTCPPHVLFQNYQRGYTARGHELWLFQPGLIEGYARRP